VVSRPSGAHRGPWEKPCGTQTEVCGTDLGAELVFGLQRLLRVALGTILASKKIDLERPWRPPEEVQERYHLVFAKDLSSFQKDVLAGIFARISQRRKTHKIIVFLKHGICITSHAKTNILQLSTQKFVAFGSRAGVFLGVGFEYILLKFVTFGLVRVLLHFADQILTPGGPKGDPNVMVLGPSAKTL
jgi:hypothetical protein